MKLFHRHLPLTEEELKEVASAIAAAESTTSGEIRVSLRIHRFWRERGLSVHELALREFYRLGMDSTKNKTGVLLFFLIKEKKFHIVADSGIHAKVADGYWDTLADSLSSHFKQQQFCKGICAAVREIGHALEQEFPIAPDDKNELSNDVVIS
jgi:uncharacterized membrane protein